MVLGSARNWIAVNAAKQTRANQNTKQKGHMLCHAQSSLTPSIGVRRPHQMSFFRSSLTSRNILGMGGLQPPQPNIETPSTTPVVKCLLTIRRRLTSKAL